MLRLFSSLGFVLGLGGLFLPFVAADNTNPAGVFALRWQGIDFVLGGRLSGQAEVLLPDGDGRYWLQPLPFDSVDHLVDSEAVTAYARPAFIAVAVLLAVGALGPVLSGVRPPRAVATAAAFGAVIALGIGEMYAVNGIGSSPLAAQPAAAYGFWLVFALLIVLAATNLYALLRPPRPDFLDPFPSSHHYGQVSG
jgi:hypothetical protein